jgi:hypothetical protein
VKNTTLLPDGSAAAWHQFGVPVVSVIRLQPLAASQNRYGETATTSLSRTENGENPLPSHTFPEIRTQRRWREDNSRHGETTSEIYHTANKAAPEATQRIARGDQLGCEPNAGQAPFPRPQAAGESGGDAGALADTAQHLTPPPRLPVLLPRGYLPGVV